jgi:hypothetical protein
MLETINLQCAFKRIIDFILMTKAIIWALVVTLQLQGILGKADVNKRL